MLALAVSSDGALLASAGADRHVHVWDTRAPPEAAHVRAFPGHRDAVTCLAFRPGARTLFSGAADRCVKIWALDDMAYVDTLFGHSNEARARPSCPVAGTTMTAYRSFSLGGVSSR